MSRVDGERSGSSRVLVVDDDPIVVEVIAAALALEGYETVPVEDPKDAVRLAHEVTPDAITLDLEMPGLDGRRVLRRLREDPHTRRVPIVVVSGCCEQLSADDRRLAADAVAKPFDLPELLDAVEAAIRRGQGRPVGAGP